MLTVRQGWKSALVVLLAQGGAATACVSAPEDGVAADLIQSTGGTGVGGNDGGWTPTGGTIGSGSTPSTGGTSAGGTAAGGAAAGGAPCYGTFDPNEGQCGECQTPLDLFCADNNCSMPEDLACNIYGLPSVYLYRGCGYVREVSQGDVGDSWSYTWLEETGELVHFFSQPGGYYYECIPSQSAGVMPSCGAWVESCTTGAGGAGGFGGASP